MRFGCGTVSQHTCAPTPLAQVVIGLSDGEVAYFELDDEGKLDEVAKKTLGSDIASIDLPDVRSLLFC